jgi:uncharacterized membrane protein YdjX (TVP38/TMEM64 family)
MDFVPYVLLVACVICAAMAMWQLYTSTEERAERESFVYKYGAFFAYLLFAIIFIVVLFMLPLKNIGESVIKMAATPALGPVGAFVFSKAAVSNSYAPKFRKNSLLG